MAIDLNIFYVINNLALKSQFWDTFFIWATAASISVFSLILFFFIFKNSRLFWLALLAAIISRGFFTEAIRFFYYRARPFIALDDIQFLSGGNLFFEIPQANASFPSGHAAFMFAIAFAGYVYNKKIGTVLIIVALILSLARVYIGVHYPSDILGGILVALISVWISYKFFKARKNIQS